MDFRFTEDQLSFRDAVSDFLNGECTPAAVRALLDSPDGGALKFRAALAELGVAGLPIAEEHGGLGMNELDAVLVAEEFGRAAVPGALFDSIAVAAPLLAEASPELAAEWLPKVAAGEATLTFGDAINPFVLDAEIADLFLLPKDDALYAVPKSAVTLTEAPSVDPSRRPSRLAWNGVGGQKIADANSAAVLTALARDRAALYTAADTLGATQRMLDLSVEYTKNREQFGKPIGSFQAVKHLLADVQVKLTFARPVVYYAAYALANQLPDRAVRVSHAKVAAAAAGMLGARRTLQVHGAMGYTWGIRSPNMDEAGLGQCRVLGHIGVASERIADAILAPGADLGPGRTWAA